MRRSTLIAVLALGLTACTPTSQQARTTDPASVTTQQVRTTDVATATTEQVDTTVAAPSFDPEAYMLALSDLSSTWNANQSRWVGAFLDETVSYEEFVQTMNQVQIDQATLLATFTVWSNGLPAEVQAALAPLIGDQIERAASLSIRASASRIR